MRFLLDENVDVKIARLLRELGHQAARVPAGLKNGAVIRKAVEERRILITRDSDFTDTVRYPPAASQGIIHIDIHPPTYSKIAPALRALLARVPEEQLRGKLVVVDTEGFEEFPA